MIVEVIINRTAKKLNRTFDYSVPSDLADFIVVGSKVLVPFGKGGKLETAFVIAIKDKTEYEVKPIAKIEDNLSNMQIELAKWMAKRYFCNVSDCIKLMLAPGTTAKESKVQEKKINAVYLKKSKEEIAQDIESKKLKTEKQIKVVEFIKDNEGLTVPEIEAITGSSRAIVNTLVKNGYLQIVQKTVGRDPLKEKRQEKTNDLILTMEQEYAYNRVSEIIDENQYQSFLLYGVTGSR